MRYAFFRQTSTEYAGVLCRAVRQWHPSPIPFTIALAASSSSHCQRMIKAVSIRSRTDRYVDQIVIARGYNFKTPEPSVYSLHAIAVPSVTRQESISYNILKAPEAGAYLPSFIVAYLAFLLLLIILLTPMRYFTPVDAELMRCVRPRVHFPK